MPETPPREDREPDAPRRPEEARDGHVGEEERSAIPNPDRVQGFAAPYVAARYATGVRQEGTVLGGESYGFVQTLNRIVVPKAGGSRVAVGTVEPELLEKVRAVVVPPTIADRALRILQEQRVLVLQGRAHWGKATLALWLLSRVGRDDGGPPPEVYAIAPDVRLDDLPEGFLTDGRKAGGRYLVDTLSGEAAGALRLQVLRAVCDQLGGGYLVVTLDSRTPIRRIELRDYLASCKELPDPEAVLRRNLRWRLDGQEPPDHVLEVPWVREELRRAPVPGHLDQLAEVLTRVVHGTADEADAEAAYAILGRLRAEEWFESHPDLPERCLMVAGAVLNGASYHEVADAADALRLQLEPPGEDGQPARPLSWGLGSPRRQLVEDVGGRVVTALRSTTLGPSPTEVFELEDISLQREVLEHVWWGHDTVRSALLEWLATLGRDDNLDVSGRAAAAVGALCRKDLAYLHNRLLIDWATEPQVIARVSAAVALDVAASDQELAKQVRTLLHHWVRRNPRSRQAWTATAAYGFTVGRRWPTFALQDLRLVVEEAPSHAWIASRSLANLCDAGRAAKVLRAIAAWVATDDPPEAAERALGVFVRMLHAGVDDDMLAPGTNGQEGAIPTLLRLAAEDERHRARVVGLWKEAFYRAETRQEALDALGGWITLADEHPGAAQALDTVALELLKGTPDEQDDLADALREWANDPRRPSTTARLYLQGIGKEVSS